MFSLLCCLLSPLCSRLYHAVKRGAGETNLAVPAPRIRCSISACSASNNKRLFSIPV
jgi:hypothetical protein